MNVFFSGSRGPSCSSEGQTLCVFFFFGQCWGLLKVWGAKGPFTRERDAPTTGSLTQKTKPTQVSTARTPNRAEHTAEPQQIETATQQGPRQNLFAPCRSVMKNESQHRTSLRSQPARNRALPHRRVKGHGKFKVLFPRSVGRRPRSVPS